MRTPKKTLSDVVRKYIYDGIIGGRFAPGERLRETDIAKALKLSRSPIREAIKILENEGLVISEPWKGLIIADLSRIEMVEIFVYREALEGLASQLAAASITNAEIDRLEKLIEESDRGNAISSRELVENNQDFHQLIYEAARNKYLLESVGTLRTFLALLPGSNYEKKGRREVIVQEHLDIVRALRKRDGAAAKEAARAHVRNSMEAQMSFILNSELRLDR